MIHEVQPYDFKPVMSIVACFLEVENKILLLQRAPTKPQGSTWGLAAGKIDKGETKEEAILREIREETGLHIDPAKLEFLKRLYVRQKQDFLYDSFRTKMSWFPPIRRNPREHTNHVWITPEDALRLPLVGDLDQCIRHFYRLP